ncbi:PREDICTED: placenta-expressed transcript 1 protein [Propithecus coquereli]|uniref:placenta-expressed transcript 1 protein n=1 Tax=Propithecus coquereli TaxID=379532 RepID=UPI00063F1AF3|nr:PREDICTED: placenta-expressed transcript 1 protein [Propithecus coquereli]
MAGLHPMPLPLGLLLCLGLKFSAATPTNHSDNCVVFDEVFTTTSPGIRANSDTYESNTIYTVWVPVNDNVSSVILRAVDKNNSTVGSWQGADKECNSGSLYYVKNVHDMLLQANWVAPKSENITEVELQAFTVLPHNTATLSSLKLNSKVTTTTLTSKIFTTSTSKIPVTVTSKISTTKPTTASTLPTTRSLAHRATNRPIIDAISILLAFLISKLLF